MRRHLILGTALAIGTAGLTTLASQSRPDYPYKPVEGGDKLGVAKDAWNKVSFKPVTTSALRFQVVLQPGASAGLQEVRLK